MSSTESTTSEQETSERETSERETSEQDTSEQETSPQEDAPQQEGTGSTAWKDFHHNTKPSHKTTPKSVAGAPTNLLAFAGALSVCVLPVAGALAHPRTRALLRQALPRF